MAVSEGTRGLTVEVLDSSLCLVVAVTVVPTEAEVHLQLVVVVVVQIGAEHLSGIQSATVPPACVLLFIVEIAKQDEASLVGETTGHSPRSIAVLRSSGKVEVSHVATVHALLDTEIEHGLFLTVLDASDACLVTLLVIEFQVLDNAYGNVLQGCLHIAEHELLTVEQDLLHLLAVDGDITILVDLCTGDALDELLYGRTLRCTESLGVVHDGVFADDNLCGTSCDDGLLQHRGLAFE